MKTPRFKQRIKNRLERTKLKVFEKTSWVAGNSSALMESLRQTINFGTTTAGATYSAKTAARNVANGMVDYACQDYRCLALDCFGGCCDITATVCSFFPKTKVTTMVFAGCTAGSKFAHTLRDECKKAGGLPGCG